MSAHARRWRRRGDRECCGAGRGDTGGGVRMRGAGAGAAPKMPPGLLVVAWRGGPNEAGGGPKSVSKEEGIFPVGVKWGARGKEKIKFERPTRVRTIAFLPLLHTQKHSRLHTNRSSDK